MRSRSASPLNTSIRKLCLCAHMPNAKNRYVTTVKSRHLTLSFTVCLALRRSLVSSKHLSPLMMMKTKTRTGLHLITRIEVQASQKLEFRSTSRLVHLLELKNSIRWLRIPTTERISAAFHRMQAMNQLSLLRTL